MIFSLSNLRPGMIVARDVYTTDGRVCIIRSGIVLNESMISNLEKYKISEVSVSLSPELQEKMKYDLGVNETVISEEKKDIYNAIVTQNIKQVYKGAELISTKITTGPGLSYSLSQYKEEDDVFKKSIRVSIFATTVGNRLNFIINRSDKYNIKSLDLKVLAEAALLYNIGSVCQDKREFERINSNARVLPQSVFANITPKSFVEYDPKMITLYSYNMLSRMTDPSINDILKMIVVTSLEQPNGMGPLGASPSYMKQSKTNILCAKIIKACDVFDDTLKMLVNSGKNLSSITDIMNQKAKDLEIDPVINDLLLWTIPLYSTGCKVQLSDGRYAVIEGEYKSQKQNPMVKVIPTNEVIDLSESDITIKSIVGNEVSFYDLFDEKPQVSTVKM